MSEAPRLLAPSSLRSAVRLAARRESVEHLHKEDLLAEARRDPDLVALVWAKDLGRVEAAAPGSFETLARGYVMGRPLLALRLRASAAPPPG